MFLFFYKQKQMIKLSLKYFYFNVEKKKQDWKFVIQGFQHKSNEHIEELAQWQSIGLQILVSWVQSPHSSLFFFLFFPFPKTLVSIH